MDFNARIESGCTIVSLRGRLDSITAPDCDRKFRESLTGSPRVVVDLEGLDYVSSAGLRSILLMTTLVKESNGRICLANLSPNVRTVFDISGFNRVFDVRTSVEDAISTIS